MNADNEEPQAQVSGCGLGSEQIDRGDGKDRSRPAVTSVTQYTPEQEAALDRLAHLIARVIRRETGA